MLIDKDKSSLLIIDVQEKLFSVMPKPHTFINNIVKLQKAAKILKIKNYCSEQYPNGLGKTIDKINENCLTYWLLKLLSSSLLTFPSLFVSMNRI